MFVYLQPVTTALQARNTFLQYDGFDVFPSYYLLLKRIFFLAKTSIFKNICTFDENFLQNCFVFIKQCVYLHQISERNIEKEKSYGKKLLTAADCTERADTHV